MSDYRRAYVAGGTFFFSVVTHRRRQLFHLKINREILGTAIRECQTDWPFELNAMVLLPDHLHTIWTMPPGDVNYSGRWSVIKKTFTTRFLADGGCDAKVSAGKRRERRRGVWQRRFWEHTIQDEDDFQTHFDYVHYNPVKHRLVKCPGDWEASSFQRWVKAGVYPSDWACEKYPPPIFPVTEEEYGEAF
jgi:putative transposase